MFSVWVQCWERISHQLTENKRTKWIFHVNKGLKYPGRVPQLLPYGLASPAGKTQNCPPHECQDGDCVSQHCPLSRINHQIVSFPSGNCLPGSSGFGCFSVMCWVSSTQGEQDAPSVGLGENPDPQFHGFQIAKSNCFVSVLLQRSGMCFTKTNIREPKKTDAPFPQDLFSATLSLGIVSNNTVFATKKESYVLYHA